MPGPHQKTTVVPALYHHPAPLPSLTTTEHQRWSSVLGDDWPEILLPTKDTSGWDGVKLWAHWHWL